jgi:hypothetical protein
MNKEECDALNQGIKLQAKELMIVWIVASCNIPAMCQCFYFRALLTSTLIMEAVCCFVCHMAYKLRSKNEVCAS